MRRPDAVSPSGYRGLVRLSEAQQQVVDHESGALRVEGGSGTGKTTALLGRYLRLARRAGTGRVLVVCANRRSAGRFVAAALGGLGGGLDAGGITTFSRLALQQLRRRRPRLEVLTKAEQWGLVNDLLHEEAKRPDASRLWPTLGHLLARPAFVDQLASIVLSYQASILDRDQVLARAEKVGVRERWQEVVFFASRYLGVLAERDLVDGAGVLAQACQDLEEPGIGGAQAEIQVDHVLVDDFEQANAISNRLLQLLTRTASSVVLAGNAEVAVGEGNPAFSSSSLQALGRHCRALPITLRHQFRKSPAGELVLCRHPSMEAEAVAAELLASHREGIPWADMAVLVARPARRAAGIARALMRHQIPVAEPPLASGRPFDEPVVRAVLDMLRWVDGDCSAFDRLLSSPLVRLTPVEMPGVRPGVASNQLRFDEHPALMQLFHLRAELEARVATEDPASLAHRVFHQGLAHLVADPEAQTPRTSHHQLRAHANEKALDVLENFLAGLDAYVLRNPQATLSSYLAALDRREVELVSPSRAEPSPNAVTIASIGGSVSCEWHTVVLAGCLEGELPRLSAAVGLFDPALLAPAEHSYMSSVADQRRRSLDEGRRLFHLGCSRARSRLVATAAPQPGVLLSRFVEEWPSRAPKLAFAPAPAPPPPSPTPGTARVWPEGRLWLSASQLSTYADCPLSFGYKYALGARQEGNVWAGFGSLVHQVLAHFLDPARRCERSWESLVDVAQLHWHDDIARYRPQQEEARRKLFELLRRWWEAEGGSPLAPETLAVERSFILHLGQHRIVGSIDRIDRSCEGGIEIIDYKTSRVPAKPEQVADDLQLAIYHLAATRDPELAALGPPSALRLLYLQTMQSRYQPIIPDHAERTEARVLELAERILAEEFAPSIDADCRHCDFHRLCPLQPEGQEVGQH